MTEPTLFALQTDSAWLVLFVVSFVTLPVVLLLRRLINRPGGVASGVLLSLPLALPVVAAVLYGHPVLPEIASLRPATLEVLQRSGRELQHLLFLRDSESNMLLPYALKSTAAPWILVLGVTMSALSLLRRLVGALAVRRLVRGSYSPGAVGRDDVTILACSLARTAGLKQPPEIRVLPAGTPGAFATGGSPGRVLIAEELLECLEPKELEAILAHEIAHLKARDVRLVCAAGLLRDVVAWNPIAHLAFRHLTIDRELEADRRAAAITGKPLAVASSLLKMCDLMRGRRRLSPALIGFWSSRSRVKRRVSSLLALADGRVRLRPTTYLPYIAATVVAVVLALQVGVRLTEQRDALAFVWSAPTARDAHLWSEVLGLQKRAAGGAKARPHQGPERQDRKQVGRASALSRRALELAPAVPERDLAKWVRRVTTLTGGGRGAPAAEPLSLDQGWRVQPLFADAEVGSLGLYKLEPQVLP